MSGPCGLTLPPPPPADNDSLERLELELRLLPGVLMVDLDPGTDPVAVDVVVEGGADVEALRAEAERLADGVTAPVRVRVVVAGHPVGEADRRVRLRVSRTGGTVELVLSWQGRRVEVGAPAGDGLAVAGAVLDGLTRLGLDVPHRPVAVGPLPADLGPGVLVVVAEGPGFPGAAVRVRRGVAEGSTDDEATARAVLNALNRYLTEPSAG